MIDEEAFKIVVLHGKADKYLDGLALEVGLGPPRGENKRLVGKLQLVVG